MPICRSVPDTPRTDCSTVRMISATLSSPLSHCNTIRILSSALKWRRVLRLISRTVFSTALRLSSFCLIFGSFRSSNEPDLSPYEIPINCSTCPDGVQLMFSTKKNMK